VDDLRHPELISLLSVVIDKLLYLEKSKVFDVEGVKLYPSEAHLILYLAERPDANATALACRFGVTKGAISQTLSRLRRKDVITKQRDASRKNELVLGFTPRGERVLAWFRQLSSSLRQRHDALFSRLTENEKEAVRGFLIELEKDLDSMD
jgi:DNA-binding MarR family transcriptional regulator